MTFENTRQWAKDKDGISSFLAIGLGVLPHFIHHLCASIIKQDVNTLLSDSDVKLWTNLYNRHRRLCKALYQDLREYQDNDFLLKSKPIRLFARTVLAGTARQRKRFLKLMEKVTEENLKMFAQEANAIMRTWLNDLVQDEPTPDTTYESISLNLELVFFFKIHLFCWLGYGEYFHVLYRKARHGDYNAIKKLLRIDPMILHDTFILKYFTTAPRSISHKLLIAYNNPRKDFLKISQIKSSFCGLVSAIFEHIGEQSLTPQQIRELFNSLAKDLEGKPIDEDLSEEYDAFRKAVKRYHKFWLPMIQTTFPHS